MASAKTWLLRILMSVLSLVFVCVILEVALRCIYQADRAKGGTLEQQLLRSKTTRLVSKVETDFGDIVRASVYSNITYELKPEIDCMFRNKRVITNRQGLRSPEREIKKPAGTFRILGLGDSVMFGWGVDQEDAYLAVLERQLNARAQPHPVYETINFGVPGYNTAIEAAVLEFKGLAYEPDLVVIHFINNDFGVPSFMLRPPAPLSWQKSYLLDFVKARLGVLHRSYEDEALVYSNFRNVNEEEKNNVIKEYSYMVGEDGYRRAMDRLGQLTKDRGIPVIMIVGTLTQDQRNIIEHVVGKWDITLLDIGPVTKRVMAEKGIPDEEGAFGKVGWVGPGDHHPNAFGHAIYVTGLVETMTALKLIPPTP